jgi:hypothetical protein
MENNRFFKLLESKIGDVKPLISEQENPSYSPVNNTGNNSQFSAIYSVRCGGGFCMSIDICVNCRCERNESKPNPTNKANEVPLRPGVGKYSLAKCNGGTSCGDGICSPGMSCSSGKCTGTPRGFETWNKCP